MCLQGRAVVDAMERDTGTTLATKQDVLLVKQDVVLLRQEVENRYVRLDQKIDTLEFRMTVKFGSMLIVGFGLTIAAMRLWV